jgi:MoaA/NifB/PqqE/SkfB family radical SAM enzyme
LPTNSGCNLNCSYCYITQRDEPTENHKKLLPKNYVEFILGIAEKRNIGCISLQGEEPLLPESMPYTTAILSIADQLNIPTAIVTNGTNLKEYAELLASHKCLEELTISIDAADPKTHDKLRGKDGTFELVAKGLKKAMTFESLTNVISVASVLFPGKTKRLIGIPRLLADFEIEDWFVTPALKINKDSFGGPLSTWDELIRDLEILYNAACDNYIKMIVEDEYNFYGENRKNCPPRFPFRFRNLDHPNGILRLMPDGTCEIGHDLLRKYRTDAPRWDPNLQNSDDFYKMIMNKQQ